MADALTLVLAPAVGAFACALLPARAARAVALAAMLVVALLGGLALLQLDSTAVARSGNWFALDAANAAFALLTLVVFPVVLLGAWGAPEMAGRLYVGLMLVLESALLGTFLAQDLLVLFVLWEAALLPMVLMIVTHGGPDRVRAALTFFLYTMVGSVPFLAAVILLGAEARAVTGSWTFDLATLQSLPLGSGTQAFVFVAFAVACAIKMPVFPFHGWLPRAYGEAPASGTALMAGVLSKMGAFGVLRLAIPLAPLAAARYAPVMIALGVASLLYGALLALRRQPPRALVAYASLSHMGYVVVGAFTLTAVGAQGAMLQVLSHGLAVTGLFLLVGVLERRSGDDADGVTSLALQAPRLAVVLMLFVLASVALPTTSGFAAEFLVLLGAFERGLAEWQAGAAATLVAASLACAGVVLGATYMLRFARTRVFGDAAASAPAADLGARELGAAAILLVGILWLGLWPAPAMRLAQPAVERLVTASVASAARTVRVQPGPQADAGSRAGTTRDPRADRRHLAEIGDAD
jgi:NADH-quinone oxidoreductase subunit M